MKEPAITELASYLIKTGDAFVERGECFVKLATRDHSLADMVKFKMAENDKTITLSEFDAIAENIEIYRIQRVRELFPVIYAKYCRVYNLKTCL